MGNESESPSAWASISVSHSEQETRRFARQLAESLTMPARILLDGDLGAGKTVFAKGLAEGFGVSDAGEVSSPTFTLVNRYQGRIPIYHVDLYRVELEDLYDLGIEEILEEEDAVTIIEWADRLGNLQVENAVRVSLVYVDETSRRIELATDLAG